MDIEMLFFGRLRELTGTSQEIIPVEKVTRLSDLIELLGKRYGTNFSTEVYLNQALRILINGREYGLLGGMETPLSDKDTVVFLPLIGGG
ncbi:MoaD/ThiS family protein [Chloroflexota bacterium]